VGGFERGVSQPRLEVPIRGSRRGWKEAPMKMLQLTLQHGGVLSLLRLVVDGHNETQQKTQEQPRRKIVWLVVVSSSTTID
jgi:hypothetical protein